MYCMYVLFVIIFLSSYNINSKNFQILLPMMKKTNTDVYSHSFIAKNKSHLQIYMGSHF